MPLAQALPSSKLERLSLNYNQIGPKGATALAAALPSSKLEWLNLDNNQIGDQGATALAAAGNLHTKSRKVLERVRVVHILLHSELWLDSTMMRM